MKLRMPRCPDCPYTYVKPSRFRWFELPAGVLLVRPYRCECCKRRFFGRYSPIAWLRYTLTERHRDQEAAE